MPGELRAVRETLGVLLDKLNISRRSTLGALAATVASTGISLANGAARQAPVLDPVKDMMLILKKLRFRTDDGVYFWWMVGTKLGQLDAAVTPLFNMETGTIARVAHKPDRGIDITTPGVVFYTAVTTGPHLSN